VKGSFKKTRGWTEVPYKKAEKKAARETLASFRRGGRLADAHGEKKNSSTRNEGKHRNQEELND